MECEWQGSGASTFIDARTARIVRLMAWLHVFARRAWSAAQGALPDKLAQTRFEPLGWTGNEELGYAKSITDYLLRWMEESVALRLRDEP